MSANENEILVGLKDTMVALDDDGADNRWIEDGSRKTPDLSRDFKGASVPQILHHGAAAVIEYAGRDFVHQIQISSFDEYHRSTPLCRVPIR